LAADQAVRVVYVHGSGPQPAPEDLKRALDLALFGAEQGARTAVAYFGDLLHPDAAIETLGVVAQVIAAIPIDLRETPEAVAQRLTDDTPTPEPGGEAFVRRLATALAARLARNDTAAEATRSRAGDALARKRAEASERRLLPAPIRAFLFRILIRFLLRDAYAYFFGGLAPAIHERVTAVLDGVDSAVVIGHSLGSVVAYDVLSERAGTGTVPLLLTVGSPLAIDAVKDQVHQPPSVPALVESWLNVSDPLDVIAADPTIADDYGSPDRIRDVLVMNLALNPHDLAGYLRTPEVREAVGSVVASPTLGKKLTSAG